MSDLETTQLELQLHEKRSWWIHEAIGELNGIANLMEARTMEDAEVRHTEVVALSQKAAAAFADFIQTAKQLIEVNGFVMPYFQMVERDQAELLKAVDEAETN